jgi:branched-chain amino acid transport system permease protein
VTTFVQLIVSGLATGAVYALVALGFVVIYRASRVFNFAQGELAAVGAFVMVSLTDLGLPWVVAFAGTMVITGSVAAAIERAVLRPLVGRPVFVPIILTIVVGYVLRTVLIIIWGTHPRGMPTPWETTGAVALGEASILFNSLAAMVMGALATGAFFLLIRYSRIGLGMRATSIDQEAALAVGVPVGRVLGATWFLAGVYAAVAGVFLSMFPSSVDANLGFVALRAFPAVIVGGLDSVAGTLVAGLLLGVLEVLTQGYVNQRLGMFGQNFHAVLPYVVMILFLIVRPHGLLGHEDVERI